MSLKCTQLGPDSAENFCIFLPCTSFNASCATLEAFAFSCKQCLKKGPTPPFFFLKSLNVT